MAAEDKSESSLVPYQEKHIEGKGGRSIDKRGFKLPFFGRDRSKNQQTERDQHLKEYETLLEAIDQSPDPVGTALNGLFRHNAVDGQMIERRKLEAGVKMYPRLEEYHLMPGGIILFVKQFYGGNERLQIMEIIVERMKQYHAGVESYDPYILITAEAMEETASELEKKTGQILSPKGNQIGGGTIHLYPREGQWKAGAIVWDSADIDEEGLPTGKTEVPEIDVDISLIRSIAKMIPINLRGGPALGRVIAIAPTL